MEGGRVLRWLAIVSFDDTPTGHVPSSSRSALRIVVAIIIGLGVLITNAYCPCVTIACDQHDDHAVSDDHDCDGHHHDDGDTDSHDPSKPASDDHNCSHCTGTVIAASEHSKSVDLRPVVLQYFCLLPDVLQDAQYVVLAPERHLLNQHPPNGPPTLLNLGALLLI